MKQIIRARYVALTAGILVVVAAMAYLRLSAAPVRPFDSNWRDHVGAEIRPDAQIKSMARRAQIDDYVSGIPPIGRTRLTFDSAYRSGPGGYYLLFTPESITHTIVIYHFSADGKILWKTCTWTEA